MSENNIKVTLQENRKFQPSEGFVKNAVIQPAHYEVIAREAKSDPEEYWSEAALELQWSKSWEKVLSWDPPRAQWFLGGKLNASTNCLDRHLRDSAQKAALVWEGEPGEVSVWTYSALHAQVEKTAAALRKLGLKAGDCAAIYMPMIPEAVAAMLACARVGITHTVVFGGFSAEALKDRIQDAKARVLITADGGYRKGAWIDLHAQATVAVAQCPTIQHFISVRRALAGKLDLPEALANTAQLENPSLDVAKYHDWHKMLAQVSRDDRKKLGHAAELDSEHPLFILYTSGTTGKPKGIVHTTGGFMTGALKSTRTVFDLKREDLYWCTADIGWVTGHTYLVYGPLAAGASALMYEGV